jgi:hypothetical protein
MSPEAEARSHPGINCYLVTDSEAVGGVIVVQSGHAQAANPDGAPRSGPVGPFARRLIFALTTLGVLVTALCLCLLIAVWRNDAAINAKTGHATAEVSSVSFARTVVRYNTPDGAVHIPSAGVLYPGGLAAGQVVYVEYATANPDLVRVAGRGAQLALLPIGTTVLGVWAVLGPAIWWLRRGAHTQRLVAR